MAQKKAFLWRRDSDASRPMTRRDNRTDRLWSALSDCIVVWPVEKRHYRSDLDLTKRLTDHWQRVGEHLRKVEKGWSIDHMRHDDSRTAIDFLLAKRGQLIGAGLALVFLVGGIFLIAIDKSVQGFALIGGAAAAFGGAFVYDRYQRAREPAASSGKTTQGLPSPPFEPAPDDDTNLPDART